MALERTSLLKYELTRSIFTIPDQDDKNGMLSTTCFGQNIAANRKSVAIILNIRGNHHKINSLSEEKTTIEYNQSMIGNIIGAYLTIIATDFLLAAIFCPKQVVLSIPFLSSWSGIVNIDRLFIL
jgi:hypothetical protein